MATASIAQLGNVKAKNKTATQHVLDAAAAHGIHLSQVFGVGGGDHADGYATDFMVYSNRAAGDWIADYLWANRAELGVRWIIWRQRIRSTSPGKPGTWQPMADRGSVTQNHYDHVHVKWNASPVQAIVDAVTDVGSVVTGAYTVRPGDTLASIAARFRLTVDQLVAWNGIRDKNVIVVGQTLRLSAPSARTVTVKRGDTLAKIAAALGVSVLALVAVNPQIKDPDVIQPGQTIKVPPSAPSVPVKPAPAPAPKPHVPAPKPAPKPAPAPKPTTLPSLPATSAKGLTIGARSSAVATYQRQLRAYLGKYADRYNPSGVTGYYGSETATMTQHVYRDLARKQGNSWLRGDTRMPGPSLLAVLSGQRVINPAPAPRPVAAAPARDAGKLVIGASNRTVLAYQKALRSYLGSSANKYNPAGATGYYGSQTAAMTQAVYRDLAKKQGSSWLRGDTRMPGPGLLRVLGL